ncbi:MAG: cation transporter [Oscillospiraceae bacterium]|nr:cation transporter [Oscillospiraceae bacterium]
MITLLAKRLIPNSENTSDEAVRQAYGTLCSAMGILLNLLLFAGKYLAGMLAGSVAVMADAFNNLADAGSTIITLLGMRLAGKKPDPDHPFGHGRLEYISGVAVSIMIILVGIELGQDSFHRILSPTPMETGLLTIGILAASILVKVYMFAYNHSIGRKINSPGMNATAIDSLSDCISTLVVLGSTLVAHFFGYNVDGWCGILVAAFILYAGIKSTMETLSPLLGNPPEEEFVEQIQQIVLSYDEIVNIHDLVVHDYGPGRCMISLHAEVPGDGDIFALHDAVDRAEMELAEKLGCMATIHMDPVSVNDEKIVSKRMQLAMYASRLGDGITIHDFRMVEGPTHTNVIFDAVLPYAVKMTPEELKTLLKDYVRTHWEHHHAVITIDRPYHS